MVSNLAQIPFPWHGVGKEQQQEKWCPCTIFLGENATMCSSAISTQRHHLEQEESAAHQYLLSLCWPDAQPRCPRCAHTKIYTLNQSRLRCAACKYTFRPFTGRWLDNGALCCTQWLALIRLFAHNTPTAEIMRQLGISYNTVFKAITAIRFAILAQAPDNGQLMGAGTGLDSYLNGARLTGGPTPMNLENIPVYGIIETEHWVFIDLLPEFYAETLFHFHLSFHLGIKRLGHLVYTDRYKNYNTLIMCGNDSLPYNCIRRTKNSVQMDETNSPFWTFALENLKRLRGISCQRFPLYLKELEFRYNNRHKQLIPLVEKYVCGLVRTRTAR